MFSPKNTLKKQLWIRSPCKISDPTTTSSGRTSKKNREKEKNQDLQAGICFDDGSNKKNFQNNFKLLYIFIPESMATIPSFYFSTQTNKQGECGERQPITQTNKLVHTPGPGPSSRSSPLRSDSGVSQQKQVKLILSDCRVLLANIVPDKTNDHNRVCKQL